MRTRAKVDVVGVLEPWGSNAPFAYRVAELGEIADIDEVDRGRGDELQRRLDDGLAELPEPVRGAALLLRGDPADELAGWADAEQPDLLVVGSRGYGPAKRVLLGGVTSRLVRSTPCPILVVPKP
jgi:nucleotide-binding universal stress UspA family protein